MCSNDARSQCKEALLNRNKGIHLCDSCRRKRCQSRDSLPPDRRMIYCRSYKVKTGAQKYEQ